MKKWVASPRGWIIAAYCLLLMISILLVAGVFQKDTLEPNEFAAPAMINEAPLLLVTQDQPPWKTSCACVEQICEVLEISPEVIYALLDDPCRCRMGAAIENLNARIYLAGPAGKSPDAADKIQFDEPTD